MTGLLPNTEQKKGMNFQVDLKTLLLLRIILEIKYVPYVVNLVIGYNP